MEPNQTLIPQKSGFKAIYGVIIAIVAIIGGLVFWNLKNTVASQVVTPAPIDGGKTNPPTTPVVPIIVDNKKYKDGTYTESGTYSTPEGRENISITLVLKNNIVTGATFTGSAGDRTSQRYMNAFNQGFNTEVIGKSIDSISLTVVNGASLTPKGFMDALSKIKTQARV